MTTEELRNKIIKCGNYSSIAELAGVSRQYVYALASGKRKEPSHSIALQLIKAVEELSQ